MDEFLIKIDTLNLTSEQHSRLINKAIALKEFEVRKENKVIDSMFLPTKQEFQSRILIRNFYN